ncbi:MAG: winged helix-turn-helix transcriptional regulator [Leptolyngbya sp. SIO1D8]|nr:winged helix-turn-helix transcriptional regulator [Leptolyngbya sp. SIO1D8]
MAEIPMDKVFHALADPLRIQIIESLRHTEYCVQDLCNSLNVSQSKLSFHLRVLKEASIVRSQSRGRWNYYSLNLPQIAAVEQHLAEYRCQAQMLPPHSRSTKALATHKNS